MVTCSKNFLQQTTQRLQQNQHISDSEKLGNNAIRNIQSTHAYANSILVSVVHARGNSCYTLHEIEWCYSVIAVLESAGVPVTGGPPMLMSNAVYLSWRSIYGLNDQRLLQMEFRL